MPHGQDGHLHIPLLKIKIKIKIKNPPSNPPGLKGIVLIQATTSSDPPGGGDNVRTTLSSVFNADCLASEGLADSP